MKFVFRISGDIKGHFRALTLAIRVQLLSGWNTYLLFSLDVVNFVWKIDEGEVESIVLLIFVLWHCFNLRWMRGGGVW